MQTSRWRWAGALVLALAIGCGGGGGGGDDAVVDDGGGPGDDGGGGGGPDAAVPLPTCQLTCATAADCASGPAGGIIDADNYACDGGRCVWRGCLSTQECVTTYGSSAYTCAAAFGQTLATCWPTCSTADDCANPQVPIFGADNYACDGGKCRWTGCTSTDECVATYQSNAWSCTTRGGATTPSCWPTCTTPSDCATASAPYDADNYACDDGACVWTGCNTTAECTTLDPDYVCE
ncbi:MAG: hypothetical protein H6709_13535 [Kofleriaceae bacterium]|nr:hypothetical protein [Myxococcales bacterium]MCB9561931.1 hypothetical protein [Kofleriaceae bacterium]MCB9573100.1 hypothetical protein [Kofleriaceae bacterium]